ncbi:MAG: DUF1732 domain-containing protein [Candidatus Aminicenantes bacterium]|nr:MAG: DUF1732 domain-containing protein [Candidatus Aminicenantes bacterium]
MKSMTGFAQGRFEFDSFSLNIMFKSLNHRFLDIIFKGTGINPTTEKLIKEIVKNRVFRGKIEVVFDLFDNNQRKCNIHFNEGLSAEILDELLLFKKRYKDKIGLSLDSLLKIPMIFHLDYLPEDYTKEEEEEIRCSIESVFSDFLKSREQEGGWILKNLLESIEKIESHAAVIEAEADKVEKELFLKFKERMSKYLKESEIDERRILQEAAILAEKGCINEEIHRLATHTKRLKELLTDEGLEAKGREADFLAQEMQRETHTIASKTTSMEVHEHVLYARREIEKIKQQVQNVE